MDTQTQQSAVPASPLAKAAADVAPEKKPAPEAQKPRDVKKRAQPAVVVSAKRDDIVWKFLAVIEDVRQHHAKRIVEAAEDLLNERPLCKEDRRMAGLLLFTNGEIVGADWYHFRAAKLISHLAWMAGESVNYRCFRDWEEFEKFQERRRQAAIEREKKDADTRRAKAPPRHAQRDAGRQSGTASTGYGTTKPMPKGRPSDPRESTHSVAARNSNIVTAIAVAEGKPRSEIAERLGLEPSKEERASRRLDHLGVIFAKIGRLEVEKAAKTLAKAQEPVAAPEPTTVDDPDRAAAEDLAREAGISPEEVAQLAEPVAAADVAASVEKFAPKLGKPAGKKAARAKAVADELASRTATN